MIWDMLYSMHLFVTDMTGLTFFLLLHFTFELLGIFMVITNIVKIELINATENCLLNIFSVKIFLPAQWFLINPILIWSRSRDLDVIWTNILYNILCDKYEFLIVKRFPNLIIDLKDWSLVLSKWRCWWKSC